MNEEKKLTPKQRAEVDRLVSVITSELPELQKRMASMEEQFQPCALCDELKACQKYGCLAERR
jgi:hypothetical protein